MKKCSKHSYSTIREVLQINSKHTMSSEMFNNNYCIENGCLLSINSSHVNSFTTINTGI